MNTQHPIGRETDDKVGSQPVNISDGKRRFRINYNHELADVALRHNEFPI
jgi:hypothetical protein